MSDSAAPTRLIDLAMQGRVPQALTDSGRQDRFGDTRDLAITPGQVWRATWQDVSLLVLITQQVDSPEVGVIPLTLEPDAGDDKSLILAPSLTAFGVEVMVAMDLDSTVPICVLDEIVDEWTEDVTNPIMHAASQMGELPKGIRRGNPVETEFDRSLTVRAELKDDIEALRLSPALPVETQGTLNNRTLANVLGKEADLVSLLSVLEPLGFNQPEVMQLMRGKRPMTPEVADAVSAATGVDRELVAKAVQPLPLELVIEVNHPKWRTAWETQARKEQIDEFTVRMKVGYDIFALAARQTGTQKPDWSARIVQYQAAKNTQGQS